MNRFTSLLVEQIADVRRDPADCSPVKTLKKGQLDYGNLWDQITFKLALFAVRIKLGAYVSG